MYTPSLAEFRRLARHGNLIPVYREILADVETPLSAYQKLRVRGPSFLLESVEGGEKVGRYSFVGVEPSQLVKDSFAELQRVMGVYRPVEVPGLPRFYGGAVGYLGYEFVHEVEPSVPRPARDELGVPTLCFMVTDTLVIFDRVNQTIKVVANAHVTGKADEAYRRACRRIDQLLRRLELPLRAAPRDFGRQVKQPAVRSNMTPARHEEIVRRAIEYIRAGDIIQVVLSQRFAMRNRASGLDVYRALRSLNPSPYMFLLDFGEFQLVGASPEIHVRCENRQVAIRPIAGTRWRGQTAEEDARLEKELLADEKERAEHLMLVDLARNDIGRVCEYGSVRVEEFMTVERYSHVMHIVSHVTGVLQAQRNAFDLMRATFPAGTVSGAPKVRAMQIISELEQTQRGPYAGAVGYFAFNGNLDSCITLRTALLKDGRAYVQAGGGIVADSQPQYEFNETVNKARAVLTAVAMANGWTRGR